MHIVGIVKDQEGEKYDKVKSSWGESGKLTGFLYMSASYFRLKTVFVTVNKNSIPKDIAKKIEL